jgi:carbon monoxide dehydrogenase subunit G
VRLERTLAVPEGPEQVWKLFWDIPTLASCIPGCTDARALADPLHYAAVVEVRVGRFRVEFELEIIVVESVDGQMIKARAQGRDRRTRSAMVSDLELRVAVHDTMGTLVKLQNDLQVYGRLGSMGHNVVKRRSEDLMDEFATNLRSHLAHLTQAGASS